MNKVHKIQKVSEEFIDSCACGGTPKMQNFLKKEFRLWCKECYAATPMLSDKKLVIDGWNAMCYNIKLNL